MSTAPIAFGLPGSLGTAVAVQRALLLETHLAEELGTPFDVRVFPDYGQLEKRLLSGELKAAWGPPAVVAKVEKGGGAVAVRGIRSGSGAYRSVLLAHRDRVPKLEPGVQLRCAWVDRRSIGGFLLPIQWLREKGIEPAISTLVGSYQSALDDLLQGQCDLTAIWCSAEGASKPYAGHRELLKERAEELVEVGFTRECPNDGIVLAPGIDASLGAAITESFLALEGAPAGKGLLRSVFGMERFEVAPAGSYGPLIELFG